MPTADAGRAPASASNASPRRPTLLPTGRIGERLAHPLLAAAVVFGAPCVYGVLCAMHGDLPLGRQHFGASGSPLEALALWGVAVALGAASIGLSLRFGLAPGMAPRRRDAWAAGFIVAGAALLFLSARLLRPMLTA